MPSFAKALRIAKKTREDLFKSCTTSYRCFDGSIELAKRLKKAGFEPKMMYGAFVTDRPMSDSTEANDKFVSSFFPEEEYGNVSFHYWIVIGTTIIDITADQFQEATDEVLEEVLVIEEDDSPYHITVKQSFGYF